MELGKIVHEMWQNRDLFMKYGVTLILPGGGKQGPYLESHDKQVSFLLQNALFRNNSQLFVSTTYPPDYR